MFHIPTSESTFYSILLQIDHNTVSEAQTKPCAFCNGPLDRADFLRKPRGLTDGVDALFNIRFSLCCRREGCRRRTTPISVRFFGRAVYLMFFIILTSSTSEKGLRRVAARYGVSLQTIYRWRQYWQQQFPKTPFWRRAKGLVVPSCKDKDLPKFLLQRFRCSADIPLSLIPILRFLAPCPG